MNNTFINVDCKYFRADIPCKPHKESGYHCKDCPDYQKKTGKVLIIKLGAIGDVIRTTPLLHRLWNEYPNSLIWWLTYSPDVLPNSIDKIFNLNVESVLTLQATEFDLLINLDKDYHACALTNSISAKRKIGYFLKNGKPAPIDSNAEHKFLTGIFDDISKENKKSYLSEIFEICGFEYKHEEYLIDLDSDISWSIPSEGKKIIGLNTGCGERWVSRLWSNENWIKLVYLLKENGYFPMLLGGKQEHEKNLSLSDISGAYYPGYFSLKQFVSLVNQCDLIVTQVTMAMHIATALKKKLVLMNNIFNPYEFELFGRGLIVQPEKPCTCYFSPKCKNAEYFCMEHLLPSQIFTAVKSLV